MLDQNFPNPFSAGGGSAFGGNPSTAISYELPVSISARGSVLSKVKGSDLNLVTLKVFDLLGRQIAVLVNSEQAAGRYTVQWDGRNADGESVTSGVYFYQLRAGHFMSTRKMLLLR
jgi:hypothetical protein